MSKLSLNDYLEILESLLEMSARKEAEIAELKAQLDVFKPKDVDLQLLDDNTLMKGKVLLVFKSKTLREILKTMLETSGTYTVTMLEPYDDVKSAFALYNPDICVIEHEPFSNEGKSINIVSELRKMSGAIGLIAVLPENDVDVIREIVKAGVDDFLVKPIDTRRMNNVIRDIMMRRSVRKTG